MTDTTPLREQFARAIKGRHANVYDGDEDHLEPMCVYQDMSDACLAILAAQPRPELGGVEEKIKELVARSKLAHGGYLAGNKEREVEFKTLAGQSMVDLLALIARLAAPPATREAFEKALRDYRGEIAVYEFGRYFSKSGDEDAANKEDEARRTVMALAGHGEGAE